MARTRAYVDWLIGDPIAFSRLNRTNLSINDFNVTIGLMDELQLVSKTTSSNWANGTATLSLKFSEKLNVSENFDNAITIEVYPNKPYPTLIELSFVNGGASGTVNVTPDMIVNNHIVLNVTPSPADLQYPYDEIVMRVKGMSMPNVLCEIKNVYFGRMLRVEKELLSSAHVIEDMDPISSELAEDVLEFKLQNDPEISGFDFDVRKNGSDSVKVAKFQSVKAYYETGGVETFMGRFFLSEWTNESARTMNMKCTDVVGYLETVKFIGGVYDRASIQTVLDDVLNGTGITYTLLNSAISIDDISGIVPAGSVRDALQIIGFITNTCIDTSRSWGVKLGQFGSEDHPTNTLLTGDRLFDTVTVTPIKLKDGIEIKGRLYQPGTIIEDILETVVNINGTFSRTVTISLPDYAKDISVQVVSVEPEGYLASATILSKTLSEAIIKVDVNTTFETNIRIKLTGTKYLFATSEFRIYNGPLDPLDNQYKEGMDVLKIDDLDFYSGGSYQSVALSKHSLINRENFKHKIEFDFLLNGERIGSFLQSDSNSKLMSGYIKTLNIDLTGGLVTKLTMIGSPDS